MIINKIKINILARRKIRRFFSNHSFLRTVENLKEFLERTNNNVLLKKPSNSKGVNKKTFFKEPSGDNNCFFDQDTNIKYVRVFGK